MNKNPLKLLNRIEKKLSVKEKKQAFFTYQWENNPNKFNPLRNCLERERVKRTWSFIQPFVHKKKKLSIVDLGCGFCIFSNRLAKDKQKKVDAIDITEKALKHCSNQVNPIVDTLPLTSLRSKSYDIVLALDVIGDLNIKEHRLLFSELSRLVKDFGKIICSTPIDIYSENALEQFLAIAKTEVVIEEVLFSYHYLYIKVLDFLKYPKKCFKLYQSQNLRQQYLQNKPLITRWFHFINTTFILAYFWKALSLFFQPIISWMTQSKKALFFCEKISRTLWGDEAISHVIFIGSKKPLISSHLGPAFFKH